MSLANLFEVLMILLKYGPKVFTLLVEIINGIKKVPDAKIAEGFKADMGLAAMNYKATKDRLPLQELRDRVRNTL